MNHVVIFSWLQSFQCSLEASLQYLRRDLLLHEQFVLEEHHQRHRDMKRAHYYITNRQKVVTVVLFGVSTICKRVEVQRVQLKIFTAQRVFRPLYANQHTPRWWCWDAYWNQFEAILGFIWVTITSKDDICC